MFSTYDLAPPVSNQAIRNVKSILMRDGDGNGDEARSLSHPSLAASLHETTIDALRRSYIGFDYAPSFDFGGKRAAAAAAAAAAQKRARSPTTTVDEVIEDDDISRRRNNNLPSSSAQVLSAVVQSSNPPVPAASSAPFAPSATVDPPDYQGRSYLFPPTTLDISATLTRPPAARIPKRMLCMASNALTNTNATTSAAAGNQSTTRHGVQVLKWALPHAHLVFAGDVGGVVKAWNPSSAATMRAPVATFNSHSLPITALHVEDGGKLLSTSSHDGYVRRWDAEAGVLTHSIGAYKGGVGCSEHMLHPENPNLVLAAFDKEIALFDVRVGGGAAPSSSTDAFTATSPLNKPQRLYQGHMGGIMSIAFLNARGSMFVSSSSDKTIRTWDFRVPVQIRQMGDPSMHAVSHMLVHHNSPSNHRGAAAAGGGDAVVLAQSADNKVRVLDCDEAGRLRVVRDKVFVGHTVSGTNCQLATSRDGQYVSSGDAGGQLCVWKYDSQELVKKFLAHSGKQCAAHLWHPHEASKMVTGGWDGMVKVWV